MDLDPGIYDRLVDDALRQAIERLDAGGLTAQIENVNPSALPELMADVLSSWTRQGLELVGEKDREVAAALLADSMLRVIESLKGVGAAPLESPLTRLLAVEKLSPLDGGRSHPRHTPPPSRAINARRWKGFLRP